MIISRRSFCALLTATLSLGPVGGIAADTKAQNGLEAENSFETDRIVVKSGPKAGSDVILLPGLATPGAVWDNLVSDLEGRATVHVVDVKGFGVGDGAANAEGGMMEGVLADIAAFIELDHVCESAGRHSGERALHKHPGQGFTAEQYRHSRIVHS